MVNPVTQSDEHDLVQSAQAGDRRAFAALVERHWDRLYRWLFRLTRDQVAAEHATQESFVKALTELASVKPGTQLLVSDRT